MTQSDERLNEILQLSHRMHALAADGDWDAVFPLENRRRNLIADCFAPDIPFRDPELAARRIQRILDLDRSLMDMGVAQRQELGTALKELHRGRSAAKAYQRCER